MRWDELAREFSLVTTCKLIARLVDFVLCFVSCLFFDMSFKLCPSCPSSAVVVMAVVAVMAAMMEVSVSTFVATVQ